MGAVTVVHALTAGPAQQRASGSAHGAGSPYSLIAGSRHAVRPPLPPFPAGHVPGSSLAGHR